VRHSTQPWVVVCWGVARYSVGAGALEHGLRCALGMVGCERWDCRHWQVRKAVLECIGV